MKKPVLDVKNPKFYTWTLLMAVPSVMCSFIACLFLQTLSTAPALNVIARLVNLVPPAQRPGAILQVKAAFSELLPLRNYSMIFFWVAFALSVVALVASLGVFFAHKRAVVVGE